MTTAEKFRRIRNLFDAALEKAAGERDAFLEESCAGDPELLREVSALLDAREHRETWIDRPAIEVAPSAAARLEGRRIGPYEVLRQIASGGMGTVYLARRADGAFQMRVALKVLRPETASAEILRRFQQEREILASLEHPNIARILDGGQTEDGLPYLAMEFIQGTPIDEYCDQHRLNITDRLKLFRSVCAAVRYAHQRGVVHRDLKPSNVLVTADGTVKLLDFGISKVLGTDNDEATACVTRTGLCLMTPEYASPEQIRGEAVSAATDVYSLGVVLYELVTGHRPYRLRSRVFHEIVRAICEEPPTRPSTAAGLQEEDGRPRPITPAQISVVREGSPVALRRRLSGDVDAILMKALEKKPSLRYRSVEALDSEITRHLEGHRVEARRPLPFEMAATLIRRYSSWIIGAAAVGALLVSGLVQVKREFAVLCVGVFAGGMLLLLASSLELGRAVARRLLRLSATTLLLVGLLSGLAVVLIRESARTDILLVMQIGIVAVIAFMLARWPFRHRWAGSLLLRAARPRPLWMYMFFIVWVGATIYRQWIGVPAGRWPETIGSVVQVAAMFLWLFFFYTKTEVRERGIVGFGQLFSWRRLEAHWWEAPKGKAAILRLDCGGFRRILPAVMLLVPAELKAQIEALIEKYQAEWPAPKDSRRQG